MTGGFETGQGFSSLLSVTPPQFGPAPSAGSKVQPIRSRSRYLPQCFKKTFLPLARRSCKSGLSHTLQENTLCTPWGPDHGYSEDDSHHDAQHSRTTPYQWVGCLWVPTAGSGQTACERETPPIALTPTSGAPCYPTSPIKLLVVGRFHSSSLGNAITFVSRC